MSVSLSHHFTTVNGDSLCVSSCCTTRETSRLGEGGGGNPHAVLKPRDPFHKRDEVRNFHVQIFQAGVFMLTLAWIHTSAV